MQTKQSLRTVWKPCTTALALLLAVSCSSPADDGDSGSGGSKAGNSGSSGGSGGSKAGSSGSSGGSGGSGGSVGGSGGSPSGGGGSPGGAGGSPAGGEGGAMGGAGGGMAGMGGQGGGSMPDAAPPDMAPQVGGFGTPCTTEPAMEPPSLGKMQITSLPGGVQAGQVVGIPGQTRIYIIGHKDGNIYTMEPGGERTTVEGARVSVATGGNNEQGLLGMAFHPKFAENKLFYLFYTASGGGRITVDEFELTTPTTATKKGNLHNHAGSNQFHNGGSIYFSPKDATPILYLAVGDALGRAGSASAPEGNNGRILKIDTTNKMASTLHYNIRNPYRISVDRLTGDVWIGNVAGPQGGQIYFGAQDRTGINWGHDSTNNTINGGRDGSGNAIIGGVVYRGNKIAGLCGRYFYGQHNSGIVKSLIQRGGERVGNVVTHGSLDSNGLSSFGEDGEGEIYISTLGGQVFKVVAQ